MPTGLPGFGQRRTSYVSVASGVPSYPRVGDFAHLLNPTMDGAEGHGFTGRGGPSEGVQNGSGHNGTSASQRYSSSRLPPSSRTYESLVRSFGSSGFFIPSYLQDSTYAQQLEEDHRATLAVHRDSPGSVTNGSSAPTNNGGLASRGSKLAASSHLSTALSRTGKLPPFDDDEAVPHLPSAWNKEDRWKNVEVLSDGLDAKYNPDRSSSSRDREQDHEASAVRANHYMPPQCGLYYFEVTLSARKHNE
jgi:Ran-binding protein 9/10